MPRFRQAEREEALLETRQRLLNAALAVFASQGYGGANINQISEQAGFAKGTIYNYFASKHDLMLALLERIATDHFAFVRAQVDEALRPAQRLEQFFAAGFAYVADHPAEARVMITTLYGSDMAFQERLFQLYQPMFGLVAQNILAQGMAQGDFRALNPVATATLLMTLYLGSSSRVDEQGKPYLDPAQVADFALRALRAG